MRKWNWTIFFVILFTSLAGAMANKNVGTIEEALLLGIVAGLIFGLPVAYLTKNEN